jgi:hypothetical protein|tara:strand:+ start:5013 stop:5159 length:147 start_codon:yes stop_codon:yes gene_type:complete
MVNKKYTNIPILEDTKEILKQMGTLGDSYDKVIMEMIECYKKNCEDKK